MIKITKHLYIHFLVPILFFLCAKTGLFKSFFLCYFVMALHEFAHLFAAIFIGITPKEIRIYPFGLNLRLKNKIVYSFADEIILYAAGPFLNACLALVSSFLKNHSFFLLNISLFFINLLPISSLDGGVILKKVLIRFFGAKKGERLSKWVSVFFVLLLILAFFYLLYKNNFNFSLLFLITFAILNLFTAEEKYDIDLLGELIFCKEKQEDMDKKKIRIIARYEDTDFREIAKSFSLFYYYVVLFLDKNYKIKKIMTEGEIIKNILKN